MAGLSGSGKSTTAQQLIASSHAIRLRSDAVRKHLAGISIHDQGSDNIYTSEMTDKTYSKLIELGVILAKRGDRIILDAKFDRRDQTSRGAGHRESRRHSAHVCVLHGTSRRAEGTSRTTQWRYC